MNIVLEAELAKLLIEEIKTTIRRHNRPLERVVCAACEP